MVVSRIMLLVGLLRLEGVFGAGYLDQNMYSMKGVEQKVRRERNLDHVDSQTLSYYLDEYRGHDVAVLLYAQWDQNSRALAPYWDRIATLLDAGSSDSRLVMALLDCELNEAHAMLCEKIGVTHYPTMMFIGSGPYHDTDPITRTLFGKKSAGIMGAAPVPNTVKFQGNWQYTDAVLDWIRTMQALSNWHTWSTQGFGKRLRTLFWPSPRTKTSLPVGIPHDGPVKSAVAASSGMEAQIIESLEERVGQMSNLTNAYEKILAKEWRKMDSLLVPTELSTIDMFSLLDGEKAFSSDMNPTGQVLKNCVAEMAVDYCQRVSEKVAGQMVEELMEQGMTVDSIMASSDLEENLLKKIAEHEPYCGILDQCLVDEFKPAECHPPQCPFQNQVACQLLTTCLDPLVQEQFAEALGYTEEQIEASSSDDTKKRGWGM